MAKSTFYYHLSRLKVPDKYKVIRKRIKKLFKLHKSRYGYRRITITLRKEGYIINYKTVYKLMQECGLKSMVRMKKYRSYRGLVGKIAPNVLERNFEADSPNQKWVTDVTEFSLYGEKRFLSPILDLYNSEILSYTISTSPNLKMVTSMISEAVKKIPMDSGLIVHSDQGWHYQHAMYQKTLKDKGIIQSMSRKGNCLDNAVIENFFGLLKSELLYLQKFSSMNEFVKELNKYIVYYNNDRIKAKLNGMSPVEYREQALINNY